MRHHARRRDRSGSAPCGTAWSSSSSRLFEATEVRLESAAAAAEIAGAVAACYERYGYTVVRVPPLPPASRLAFVLQAAGVFPKFVQ